MHARRGMSLVDVVVGTALLLIVFLTLFGLLHASLMVSIVVKNQATAAAIANSQMEVIRSLPYNSVGTVGGIPAGTVAQNATTTEDGVAYNVRTFIDYYDDPADGTGAGDTNGITTDYKRIKVTVSYPAGSTTKQVSLVSSYSPLGLETTSGGGTLQIVVVNATGQPVPGATVVVTNASTSPTVNLTTFSDANGYVTLPGAATSTQYAVNVSKSGYSTAQTYARDATNQNPTPGYLTVVNNLTTSSTFAIDVLGTFILNTYLPVATSTFSDAFSNGSKLVNTVGTTASGGALGLSGGFGNYSSSGTALSTTTTPVYLASWGVASSTMNIAGGTTAVVHVVDRNGTLLPEAVLPGNAVGFTSPVNLFSVSTSTYPALALSAALTTTSTSTTPLITGWSLSYQTGPIPFPNVSFTLTGAKTIGTTGGGSSIYKTSVSDSTKSNGIDTLPFEWDSYSIVVPSYDVLDACAAPPYALSAGGSISESLILGSSTPNSMLVTVTDSTGIIVRGASVALSHPGYAKTLTSSSCGGAYFGNLGSATDYTVVISKSGYTTTTINNITVGGHTFYGAAF
jgi:hypothetical protein